MLVKRLLYISSFFIMASCGPKAVVNSTPIVPLETTSTIIENHYNNEPQFNTLAGRLKVRYEDENNTQNVSVSLRMEKDKTIWLSANLLGIPLAKVLITPNSVKYYEKLSGTYFDGDFSLLSKELGTELDFEKVQNILLGMAIYNLNAEDYTVTPSKKGYVLQPKTQFKLFTRLFLINPTTYTTKAQQLVHTSKNQSAIVTYANYQNIEGQTFPAQINIVANNETQNTRIDITYRAVNFNVNVRFPFKIPQGYTELL